MVVRRWACVDVLRHQSQVLGQAASPPTVSRTLDEVTPERSNKVAPSTYCQRRIWPVAEVEFERAYLINALVTLHAEHWGGYGARKVWKSASRAGFELVRDQVARLMRIAGIRGAVQGRHRTTITRRDTVAASTRDLVKRGWDTPTAPDELRVADFSYAWTVAGFVYVAFVVDVFSRRVLGWGQRLEGDPAGT